MSDYFNILDRIKPRLSVARAPEVAKLDQAVIPEQRALVVDNEDTERTYVTVPLETASLDSERFLLRLTGRLVGSEQANSNGQLWSTGDLQFGLPSVAGGPLNWLHQERTIVGCLTTADLVQGQALRQAAAVSLTSSTVSMTGHVADPPHIKASSVLWSYLFPAESRVVESAAASGQLYYSMECISGQVQCAGDNGCGALMAYPDALHRTERACAHIRERAAARRFVDPIFQGAAVIVPPVKPGWANAHVEVMRRAEAAMAGNDQAAGFTDGDVSTMAQILAFVGAGSAPR